MSLHESHEAISSIRLQIRLCLVDVSATFIVGAMYKPLKALSLWVRRRALRVPMSTILCHTYTLTRLLLFDAIYPFHQSVGLEPSYGFLELDIIAAQAK